MVGSQADTGAVAGRMPPRLIHTIARSDLNRVAGLKGFSNSLSSVFSVSSVVDKRVSRACAG